MTAEDPEAKVKEYWESRAAESLGAPTATTQDVHLRELEIKTFVRTIESFGLEDGAQVLDLGCGDGYSTLRIALALPRLAFTGVDYAQNMVENARRNLDLHPELGSRVQFHQGDATRLKEVLGGNRYDVIMSDRCLINLLSPDSQYDAISQIAASLKPEGHYIAIENFVEGQENLNAARREMGLPAIEVRWHNLFLKQDEFRSRVMEQFYVDAFENFSSAYYYATRVLYSALCRDNGETPDYDHPIHRRAVDLPPTGAFSPICLAVLRKREEPLAAMSPDDAPIVEFEQARAEDVAALGADTDLIQRSYDWIARASKHKYSYQFDWLGRPIIQFPADIAALQEIIWNVRPELIIETGVAHGGSLILHASVLELLGGRGKVVGIDIDIRAHNRSRIEHHPLARRIELIQGSSVDDRIAGRIAELARGKSPVVVVLDSNHTAEHVRRELQLYSPLVTPGSFLVVFDTIVEYMPEDLFADRPWSKGDNPMTAVHEFLEHDSRFVVDSHYRDKLLITAAPGGYLRRVAD